jgi:hypothetical protein
MSWCSFQPHALMMLRLWLHTPDVRPNSESVHCPTIPVQHGEAFQRHHHLRVAKTQLTALSCAHCSVKLYTPVPLPSVAPSTTAASHVHVHALSTLLTCAPPTTASHPAIRCSPRQATCIPPPSSAPSPISLPQHKRPLSPTQGLSRPSYHQWWLSFQHKLVPPPPPYRCDQHHVL